MRTVFITFVACDIGFIARMLQMRYRICCMDIIYISNAVVAGDGVVGLGVGSLIGGSLVDRAIATVGGAFKRDVGFVVVGTALSDLLSDRSSAGSFLNKCYIFMFSILPASWEPSPPSSSTGKSNRVAVQGRRWPPLTSTLPSPSTTTTMTKTKTIHPLPPAPPPLQPPSSPPVSTRRHPT